MKIISSAGKGARLQDTQADRKKSPSDAGRAFDEKEEPIAGFLLCP